MNKKQRSKLSTYPDWLKYSLHYWDDSELQARVKIPKNIISRIRSGKIKDMGSKSFNRFRDFQEKYWYRKLMNNGCNKDSSAYLIRHFDILQFKKIIKLNKYIALQIAKRKKDFPKQSPDKKGLYRSPRHVLKGMANSYRNYNDWTPYIQNKYGLKDNEIKAKVINFVPFFGEDFDDEK